MVMGGSGGLRSMIRFAASDDDALAIAGDDPLFPGRCRQRDHLNSTQDPCLRFVNCLFTEPIL